MRLNCREVREVLIRPGELNEVLICNMYREEPREVLMREIIREEQSEALMREGMEMTLAIVLVIPLVILNRAVEEALRWTTIDMREMIGVH